jgi:hypothetical protein
MFSTVLGLDLLNSLIFFTIYYSPEFYFTTKAIMQILSGFAGKSTYIVAVGFITVAQKMENI